VLFNSKPRVSLLLWWLQEPGWEAPGPIIEWEDLVSVPLGTKDTVLSNDFPNKWGKVPEIASSRGTPS
jgi:hypothetical protein